MYLNRRQKELIKDAIEDYKFIKEELENKISKGFGFEELSKFICKFRDTEITGIEDYDTYGYLDFNFKNVNCCVSYNTNESNNKNYYVGTSFEIYDNINNEYIYEDFLTIKEYENLLNKPKEKVINELAFDLKYWDSQGNKNMYDNVLEKIATFLKEEY